MPSYCIICGKKRNGIEVKNDYVIEAIRLFKRNVTKDVKGSRLVVCKECYPEYKKRRDKYTSRQILYVALGILFALFSLIISPSLPTLLIAIVIIIVLYAMSLFNYAPDLKLPAAKKANQNQ